MHEVSICEGILKTISSEFDQGDLENVREIHVKVGVLSCVDSGVLKHVFKYIIAGTAFQRSELIVELADVSASAKAAVIFSEWKGINSFARNAGEAASNIVEGNELLINKIVLEEPVYEKDK